MARKPRPRAVAAVSAEDVRRAFYASPAGQGLYVEQVDLDPLQLIVVDQANESRYRVSVTLDGDEITFGDPVPVTLRYEDATPEVAAHARASVVRFERQSTPAAPVQAAASRRRGPTMTPQQAFESGRVHRRGLPDWERRYAADPAGVGETLASLSPVLAEERAVEAAAARGEVWATMPDGRRVLAARDRDRYSTSDTPLMDELEEALYGPSQDERRRREDIEAEAQLREQLDEEQRVEAAALTDDEIGRLFGE